MLLEVGFPAAQAGLAALAQDSSLLNAAENAYGAAARSLARVSPPGAVPGISTLAEVRFRDLVARDGSALLTLRWDVTGPGGALFPALDADITLTRTGGQATLLALTGVYRPPLGILGAPLDRAVLREVAAAMIHAFVTRIAEAIAHRAGEAGSHSEVVG